MINCHCQFILFISLYWLNYLSEAEQSTYICSATTSTFPNSTVNSLRVSYNCILTVMVKIHLFWELDPDFVGMLHWRSLPNREIFSQGAHDVDPWPMAEHSWRSGSAVNECQISLPESHCPWVGIAPVQSINLYHLSQSALDLVIMVCVRCGAS